MPNICPWLGLAEDRTLMRAQPDAAHRCYAVTPTKTPDLDHQRDFCLAAKHVECPYFARPENVPLPEASPKRRDSSRLVRLLPLLILGAVLVVVAAVYGPDLFWPSPAAPASANPIPTALQAVGATALRTTATSTAAASAGIALEPTPSQSRYSTPTPEPNGRVLALEPRRGDAGWWSSSEARGRLADSFLYAGFYQGHAFVSAARFELGSVPRGAPMRDAAVVLTGLNDERFDPAQGGTWNVQLLAQPGIDSLAKSNFQEVYNAPVAAALFPTLFPADLGRGVTNVLPLDAAARDWLAKQIVDGAEAVIVRITGPTAGDTVFAWDGGTGAATAGASPRLVLSLGPAPPTPPPLPTEAVIVVTVTPTPANIVTVAAQMATASAVASTGTPTRLAYRMVTATPLPANLATAQALGLSKGLQPIVVSTPTPANGATATYQAEVATAVAMTTGTFTPVPTNAVTPVVIMPTPMPKNVMTAAAQMRTATAVVANAGTMTPLPFNAVVATPTEEPFIIVNTAIPENRATAQAIAAYATAVAATTGTFTPIPASAIRATSTPRPTTAPEPTPTRVVVYVDEITPQAPPTPAPTQSRSIPADLKGKILFRSDREGGQRLFSYDPVTGRLAYLLEEWPYALALGREALAPDGQRSAIVAEPRAGNPRVYVRDARTSSEPKLLAPAEANSYDPAWGPRGDRIAFVSEEAGNAEIYTARPDGSDIKRLTVNGGELDRHPSWSPDGTQILFSSNRATGRLQLWIMNADGSNQRVFLESAFNDWDPIWVK